MKPRLLIAGRNRYRLPLDESLRRKFDALGERFELRVLGTGVRGSPLRDDTFRLFPPSRVRRLEGVLFYLTMPARVARELREFDPVAVHTQSAYEAAAVLVARRLARSRAKVVVDVHGDWRTLSRLYGSPWRRVFRGATDAIAASALRRADAVRAVSEYTAGLVRELGVEPAGVFPAYMDLGRFLEPPAPLPERSGALFVGVLERYKNVDGLAEAWRRAAPRLPGVELRIVGDGTMRSAVRGLPQSSWTPSLPRAEVARAMDAATVLALPSRSEGMGRVLIEALLRGRPIVATRVGGIRELVEDGVNGLLVPPGDMEALADALVSVLSDRALAERLAAAARPSVERWLATPEEYAGRMLALVERVAPSPG